MSKKKKKKFYYYDKDNDLLEYIEGKDGFFVCWVNSYLTLLFPHGCIELIPKNIVGFQINGMRHILCKAEEQVNVSLTPEQEVKMNKTMKEMGFKTRKEKNNNDS